MKQNEDVVVLKDVVKRYTLGGSLIKALDGLSLNVGRGTMTAIVGPSGSGKTSLLNIMGALDKPDSGEVHVDGVPMNGLGERELTTHRRNKIGFVFQTFNLVSNLNALENVMLPMEFIGMPAQERVERAKELLESLGMSHRAKHTPGKLSGGEQQRVAIARALANDPPIILADEPTGNLDSETGKQIIELLKQLVDEEKKTMVVVTHSQEIQQIADVAYMIRDGIIIENSSKGHAMMSQGGS